MAAEVGRDEPQIRQAVREPPVDRPRAGDAVQRDDRPSGARTEFVHVQPHAAIMGQRLRAGR